MRTIGGLALTLVLLCLPAPADDLIVPPVGDLGDPRRLEFRGIETFSIDQVRDALSDHFDYQFAAHPAGSRQQLLSRLKVLIQRGYLRAGFPRANVRAVYEPAGDRVRVTVVEGARMRAGEIRVVGDTELDIAQFVQSLTAPAKGKSLREIIKDAAKDPQAPPKQGGNQDSDDAKKPVWSPGKPVPFDSVSAKMRNRRTEDALADLGYLDAKVSATVEPSPGSDAADLVVSIEDLGPPCAIDEIRVEGLEKNSKDTFLEYFGLETGEALTAERLRRLNEQLYESARFWQYRVVPEPLDTQLSRVRLSIEVVEYPPAPSLNADFSPPQRLLLALRDQLENLADSDDELVIHGEGNFDVGELGSLKSVTCVVAPSGGVLFAADGMWGSQRPAKYAAVMTPDGIGLYAGGRGEKYQADLFGQTLVVTASSVPLARNDTDEFRSNLNFSAGLQSDNEQPNIGPFKFGFRLTPVAMLRETMRGRAKVTTRDGVTKFEREGQSLALDAETGRLIEWVWHDSKTGERIEASLARGEFDKRVAAWQEQTTPGLNYHHPHAPFASLAAFLGDEWIWARGGPPATAPAIQRRLSLLSRVIDETLVASLHKTAPTSDADQTDEKFMIPSDWEPGDVPPNQTQLLILGGARLLPGFAEQLFPRHSWPWTLSRETAFFIHGKRTYTGGEIKQLLESNEIGPLGCLAIGRVLAQVSPDAARRFAAKGKAGNLTLSEFRKDARLLTQGDKLVSRAGRQVAKILRDAEPAEIEAVTEILPDEVAAWLPRCAATLRLHADQPAEDVLQDSLDDLWQGLLKDWARGELEALSKPAGQAP